MTRQIVLSLICLAGISSSTHAADLVAETYGRPSGDIGFLAGLVEHIHDLLGYCGVTSV